MLTRQYELFKMKKRETIIEMYTRLTATINNQISLGDIFPCNKIMRKIISILPPSWDSKVNSITKTRNLNTITLDDLIGNLDTYELKLNQDRLDRQASRSRKTKNLVLKATHKQDTEEYNMALLTRRF